MQLSSVRRARVLDRGSDRLSARDTLNAPGRAGHRDILVVSNPLAPTMPTPAAAPLPSHPTLLAGGNDIEPRSLRRSCSCVEVL
jgi:hypothetical protein